ncbi:uncharacterized protein LOC143458730 [Clavelina lepadiformis]|uniref:uncharacterized protein LOC143458730 n=1 Tax=Clavelina lepadiformis TaxID=159417 RepID=UPI0040420D29
MENRNFQRGYAQMDYSSLRKSTVKVRQGQRQFPSYERQFNAHYGHVAVSNSQAELCPSPIIKPLAPCTIETVLPSVAEPSLIFDESYQPDTYCKQDKQFSPNNSKSAALASSNQPQGHLLSPTSQDIKTQHAALRQQRKTQVEKFSQSQARYKSVPEIPVQTNGFTNEAEHTTKIKRQVRKPTNRLSNSVVSVHSEQLSPKSNGSTQKNCVSPKQNISITSFSSSVCNSVTHVNNNISESHVTPVNKNPTEIPIETDWMKGLPPKAFELFVNQDMKLKELQVQVQQLLSLQKKSSETTDKIEQDKLNQSLTNKVDAYTQTDLLGVDIVEKVEVNSIGVNTSQLENTSVYEKEKYTTENTTDIAAVESKDAQSSEADDVESNKNSSIHSSVKVEKSLCWESDSLHINSSGLKSMNNEQSIMSSLKEVDMPGLDSSEDNTSSQAQDLGQESPILGESASMYLESQHMSNRKLHEDPKEEDSHYFDNLLKQVQDMLGNVDNKSSGPQSLPATPSTIPKSIQSLPYQRYLPANVFSQLTCLGLLANRDKLASDEVSALVCSRSTDELSMHANAIALKYMSDDQLNKIASNSKNAQDDNMPPPMLPDQHFASRKTNEHSVQKMPGMNLLSPCDMSLATKKYMQKYGLIESSDNEEENKENIAMKTKTIKEVKPARKLTVFNDKRKPLQECNVGDVKNSKALKSADPSPSRNDQMEVRWSQLEDTLGETLDMLHPFLNDLENNLQSMSSVNGQDLNKQVHMTQEHDSGMGETMGQILSCGILQSLNNKPSTELSCHSHRNSTQKKGNPHQKYENNEVLAGILPPKSMKKIVSPALENRRHLKRGRTHSKNEVLSAPVSPFVTKHPLRNRITSARSTSENRSESFDRILDSRIMQVFEKGDESITEYERESNESLSLMEVFPEENILNLDKINSMPKLPVT